MNIYTTEITSDSKAIKTFYGERLDFIDETIKKKELLLFLMSQEADGAHVQLLKSIDPLELDPAMAPAYIKALLNDLHLPYVGGYPRCAPPLPFASYDDREMRPVRGPQEER